MEERFDIDIGSLETDSDENPFTAKFIAFFESHYLKAIEKLANQWPASKSLEIDFSHLEHFDFELADELLDNPDILGEAAELAIQRIHIPAIDVQNFKPHTRFYNLPKDRTPLLRNIGAEHLGKLITVEGLVRQVTDVLPKLKIAAWQCRRCGNVYKKEQDSDKVTQPLICECKHRDFSLLPEQSVFLDSQKILVQEPLELVKGSEQATNFEVIVTDDQVNKIMPGDRTKITGIVRLKTPKEKGLIFQRFLEGTHLEETAKEFDEVTSTPEEIDQIKTLAQNPKIYDVLVQSIAPSIYGHSDLKEAICLQLFGGIKKVLPNDAVIRGNVHVLIVGDPGTAKSQLLQAVNKIAPKSVYVAGKTSTGAGLCVAPDSLILNDNGLKPIQEFVETHFHSDQAREEITGAFSNTYSGVAHCLTDSLDFTESSIEKIWRINAPEKMIRIQTKTGKAISLTPATSLIRIKNNKIEWVASNELQQGDFIACPRTLPEGKATQIPSIRILCQNPHLKIADPLAGWIKEITDRLVPKYGSLQAIAEKIGKKRDTLYAVRNPKFHHGWELQKVTELAKEAGFSEEEISSKITTLFLSHGKPFRIPQYMDNPDLAYLAGLTLGDGNLAESVNQGMIRIACEDPELLQEASRISRELFGIEPEQFDDGKRVPGIRIKYKAICDLIKAFGADPKKTKIQISHLATEMPNPVLAKLLQGLFDTDGYVACHRKGSPSVGISTISPRLAETLQLALLKFGIVSKKRLRKKAGKTSVGKTLTVTSRHDAHAVEITGKQNLELFQQKIGFFLLRKQQALSKIIESISKPNTNNDVIPEIHESLKEINLEWAYTHHHRNISRTRLAEKTQNLEDDHFLKKLGNANIFWDQIKTKETFKPDYPHVYDFSVKEHHNFIANGFFVHNTASAVKDEFGEGGWTLKAGALVLANGGMAMIDEFDKMDTEDRSAMHEAMEQGMISVAKAGIVTRLKTETTILAAANPKFSRFDQFKNFLEQIDLPPTLISRFDLFFMIRDVLDRKRDEEISDHILRMHQAGAILRQKKNLQSTEMDADVIATQKLITPIIDHHLLKQYIAYSRQQSFPALTKDSIKAISDFYVDLRERGKKEGTYSATHRQLEGLIRLSEASARIRLSNTVDTIDAERAIRLLKTALSELVTDKETGRIDIDLVTSGQSASQTSQLKAILNIVKTLSLEHDKVLIDQVLDECHQIGIDKEKAREIIGKLKRSGELYEPSHGVLKPVQRE